MKPKSSLIATLLVAAGAVAALAGCSASEGQPTPMTVSLERNTANRSFRVKWRTPEPVKALVFGRSRGFRQAFWKSAMSDLKLVQKGGYDVLEGAQPRSEFEVTIKEGFADVPGHHPLMTPFSDGGILFFTGHLDVSPLNCLGDCPAETVSKAAQFPAPSKFIFVPSPGETVIASGLRDNRAFEVPSSPNGTLAYFGKQNARKGIGYQIVADPSLPEWIIAETEDVLPQILELNARRLRIKLQETPIVFIPFMGDERRFNATYSGSVIDNQILLALFGSEWNARTQETRAEYLKLMAHESFHLWNSSLFHSVEVPGGKWLHEGSADAFAYLALLELGMITPNAYTDFHAQAVNRCMVGLSSGPLNAPKPESAQREFYDCGAVMQALLQRDLREAGQDLWAFWSELFDRAKGNDRFYTHESFFDLIREKLPSAISLSSIEKMAGGEVKGSTESSESLENFFISAFNEVGLNLRANEESWPRWYNRAVIGKAFSIVVQNDCGKDGFFSEIENAVRINGGNSCQTLKGERDISTLGRYDIPNEGVGAYDAYYESCRDGSAVSAWNSTGNAVELPCAPLPHRPRLLEFSTLFGL